MLVLGLEVAMGLLMALAFLLYGRASYMAGPADGPGYSLRVLMQPALWAGALLQFGSLAVLRLYLIGNIGLTRAYLTSPLAFLVAATVLSVLYRQALTPHHWLGGLLVVLGVLLLAR